MNSKNNTQIPRSLPVKQENKHLILAEIVFGDPNQVNCRGVGICRLFPQKLRCSSGVTSVSARVVFLPDGSLRMHFRRSDLPEHVYRRQFAGREFTVRTEVKWPRWLQRQLPARARAGVVPGVYLCAEYGQELVIRFF